MRRGEPAVDLPLVACLGDSITRGNASADYVRILARRHRGRARFHNGGVNGDLAHHLAQRLDPVLALRPDVVTVLIGTNDVNAHLDEAWRARYARTLPPGSEPTLAWYAEHLDLILQRLTAATGTRVAVLTLPPIGEDLTSRMNDLVRAYNAALVDVSARHGVPVLPLHERLVALLPAQARPPAYEGSVPAIMTAVAQHLLLRRSWDAIARRRGLTLLTDHLHLGDTAAAVIADLVGGFALGDDTTP
ncbi:SGNH/GDSL hydrolase family protein [Nocardioides sp.]|uniref:SGNH/GDSL hydrolase family protein n=1 Tax=Nocardioides sp. TaxID=35761 RepID=UPI0035174115